MLRRAIVDTHRHIFTHGLPMPWRTTAGVNAKTSTIATMSWKQVDEILSGATTIDAKPYPGQLFTKSIYMETDVKPAYSMLEAICAIKSPHGFDGIIVSAPLEDGEYALRYLKELKNMSRQIKNAHGSMEHKSQGLCPPSDFISTESQLVKGVRGNVQYKSQGYCLQPDYIYSVSQLGKNNLVFDVCLQAHQLGEIRQLARLCPDTTIVINHLGNPDLTGSPCDRWFHDISELAKSKHVYCKISGLHPFSLDTSNIMNRVLSHVLKEFGPSRLVFGSDWPVRKDVEKFVNELHSFLDSLRQNLTSEDQDRIWSKNAMSIYNL